MVGRQINEDVVLNVRYGEEYGGCTEDDGSITFWASLEGRIKRNLSEGEKVLNFLAKT